MTPIVCLIFALVQLSSGARTALEDNVKELSCGDNATCIENLANEVVKGVRENKTIKLFDFISIEPVEPVKKGEGRSLGSISSFLNTHALKLDLGDFGFRIVRSKADTPAVVVEMEQYNGRNSATNHHNHHGGHNVIKGGKKGTKVVQAILPLMLGLKSASTTLVAIMGVSLLVIKAFFASKLALIVSLIMAAKKLMDSFGGSSPIHHQPYNMQSSYPMDFNAGAHPAYSMPNVYSGQDNVYGMSSLGVQNPELLQHPQLAGEQIYDSVGHNSVISEVNASNLTNQYSQQIAGKRWDGLKRKSMFYDNPSK